jgi:hypothetical protein
MSPDIIEGLEYESGRFISRRPPPTPALRNAAFRIEGRFTEPEQLNEWLNSRGAVPWIDARHFFAEGPEFVEQAGEISARTLPSGTVTTVPSIIVD